MLEFFICDWIWEKPPLTHNYKSLEIPILITWSVYPEKENKCLHEVGHDSIAIYTLPMHQLLNG